MSAVIEKINKKETNKQKKNLGLLLAQLSYFSLTSGENQHYTYKLFFHSIAYPVMRYLEPQKI